MSRAQALDTGEMPAKDTLLPQPAPPVACCYHRNQDNHSEIEVEAFVELVDKVKISPQSNRQ